MDDIADDTESGSNGQALQCSNDIVLDYLGQQYNKDETGLELISATLPDLLRMQARSRPTALAIDSYSCKWTFAEMEERVATVAALLLDHGVHSDHRVGLYFQFSPWAVVTILAIQSLGATVVAVDPLHPIARRIVMFREAGVTLIAVEDASPEDWIEGEGMSSVAISGIDLSSKKLLEGEHRTAPRPKDDAFIVFTSGSSGTPKGIHQSHEAVVTMCVALAESIGVSQHSRVAQLSPYVFDVCFMEIGMCLVTGAALCISTRKDLMLPARGEVSAALKAAKATHCTMSPTMLSTMEPENVPTLQSLCIMGEPVGRGLVQKWAGREHLRLHQLWGCTEATILQSITPPLTKTSDPHNCGKAIEGACRLWIVSPSDPHILLPDGEEGELVAESRCLATWYLDRPYDTKENFLDHTKWSDPSSTGKLYKTGDLARKQPDGSIIFLGRMDSQVNRFGERLELGEIDYHLERFRPSNTLDCFSDWHAPSGKVVGFVCERDFKDQKQDESDKIRLSWDQAPVSKAVMAAVTKECLEKSILTYYMVSEYWIPIRRRPLTVSGKTDRSYLKELMRGLSAEEWDECCVV